VARSILETGDNCPGALIWTQNQCGRVDNFGNYDIGEIVQHITKVGRAFAGVAHHETDTPTTVTIKLEAWPPLLDIDALTLARIATTEVLLGNDVVGNSDLRCTNDCGTTISPGETVVVVPNSAPAAATGNVLFSTDFGETFAAGATDPFGAGFHTKAVCRFPYGTGVRVVVGRDGLIGGAVQGQTAYSDNSGATWTTVNIGTAAAQHGPMYGRSLYALDQYHIWCATNLGYIYKSIDAGLSWVAKEAGTIHVGTNYFVHFADKQYGLVGGAAGVMSVTSDGGESWQAGGIPVAQVAQCGWRMNKNLCWVGMANGALYKSINGGTTWALQTTGIPAGAFRSMWWCNEYEGFVAYNHTGPLGYIYRTVNGGVSWEPLNYVTNVGLNSVWAASPSLVFAVGEPVGALCMIQKAERAYM
jgi:photosystem II stability/assembly factor-like uncharacterized protein